MKKYVYGCVAVVCVAYLISMLTGIFGTKIDTDFIIADSLKSYSTHDAIIVRSERIVKGDREGQLLPAMNEGEKTAQGETIAHFYNQDSDALLQKKEAAEQEFVENLKAVLNKSEITVYEIQQLDNRIEDKLDAYIEADRNGDYREAVSAGRDIADYTEQRLDVLTENLPEDTYLSKLKKRVDKINKQIEDSTSSLKAPIAGMVSYSIDSFEKKAKYDKVKKMTADEVVDLIEQAAEKSGSDKDEKPTLKIVNEFEYYFVTVVDKSEGKILNVGEKREITINDLHLTLDAYVDSKEAFDDKVVVFFKTNSFLAESIGMRKVSLNIAKSSNSVSGLKVALASLYDFSEDGESAKIMLSRASFAVEREVMILESNEVTAIVKDVNDLTAEERQLTSVEADPDIVREYDEYVVNPKGITDGQALK